MPQLPIILPEECQAVELQESVTSPNPSRESTDSTKRESEESAQQPSQPIVTDKKVKRKTDIYLILPLCIAFCLVQLDRSNLQNAIADNFLPDNGFSRDNYNTANMLTLVGLLVSTLPNHIIFARYGFPKPFAILVSFFCILSGSQAFVNGNTSGWFTIRFFIGVSQGAWYTGLLMLLCSFYKTMEFMNRVAIMIAAHELAVVVGDFICAGLTKMRGLQGHPGWYWIFIVSALLNLFAVAIAWLYLPVSPSRTKSWLCPNGWYTDDELAIMTERKAGDEPPSDVEVITSIGWQDVKRTWTDPLLITPVIVNFLCAFTQRPPQNYLALFLRDAGFTTFMTNVLMGPACVISVLATCALTRTCTTLSKRMLPCAMAALLPVPCLIPFLIPHAHPNKWAVYSNLILLVGCPMPQAIMVGRLREICYSFRKYTVALATVMYANILGAIAGAYVYEDSDRPYYQKATIVLIVLNTVTAATFYIGQTQYNKRNQRKRKQWRAMSHDERRAYQEDTNREDVGKNSRTDIEIIL